MCKKNLDMYISFVFINCAHEVYAFVFCLFFFFVFIVFVVSQKKTLKAK